MGEYKVMSVGRHPSEMRALKAESKFPSDAVIFGDELVAIQALEGGRIFYTPVDEKKFKRFNKENVFHKKVMKTHNVECTAFNPECYEHVRPRRRLTSLERIIRGAQQFEELKRSQ